MLRTLLRRLVGSSGRDGDQTLDHVASRSDSDSADRAVDDRTDTIDDRADVASDEAAEDAVDGASDDATEDDDRYLWDLIPDWQYRGRHVKSGGTTVDEQQKAIESIQKQADAIEANQDAEQFDQQS